jgi:hypothetical protein
MTVPIGEKGYDVVILNNVASHEDGTPPWPPAWDPLPVRGAG